MSEPIESTTNTTPAPEPEAPAEKTFTQSEVDKMIGRRLAAAMKGMPKDEELTAFRAWKESQQTEKERWDTLTKERDESKSALTAVQAELEELQAQLADRDYMDAVSRAISAANAGKGIKFSSKAAEKAFLADLKEHRLEMKDGTLPGFAEYHKAQMEADPDAFQSDVKPPVFSKPVGAGGAPAAESKGAMFAKQFNAQYAQTQKKE